MRSDDRAVSIAISHTLTLAITAVLITTLLVGAGGFLQEKRTDAAREQLRGIGGDLSTLIDRADSLNATANRANVTLNGSYTRRVAGEPYNIELEPDGPGENTAGLLILTSDALGDRELRIEVRTDTPMNGTNAVARGGDPTVLLCSPPGEDSYITLTEC